MRIKFIEAAKNLGFGICELMQRLMELDKSLEFVDIWPDVDSSYIETLKVLNLRGEKNTGEINSEISDALAEAKEDKIDLSEGAVRIISKLKRHGKWGHAYITLEALINMSHYGQKEIKEILKELSDCGFIDSDMYKKGKISLNPKKRKEIEALVQD